MKRELSGKWIWILRALALSLALFQLYTAATMPLPTMQQRAVHVALGVGLTLIFVSPKKGGSPAKIPIYDLLLVALLFFACANAFIKMDQFLEKMMVTSTLDLTLAAATILICLEAARRVTGIVFPALVLVFLLYALLGQYIPGRFGHPGVRWDMLLMQQYQTCYGIWGFITGISATIIAIFLIFGAFILNCGGGTSFIDISTAIAGRFRGGPALIAVIGSGLFGTVCGSAVANTATTGNFTIPLMKRLGYRSEFAGGVEAAASTGGQLAPPIMGAGAFIMAELLGIGYLKVVVAAIIPAYLFYIAVFSGVLFEAHRANLAPLPPEMIPSARSVLNWGKLAPLIIPVGVLFYLLIAGFSIVRSCFYACMLELLIYVFSSLRLTEIVQRFKNIVNILESGGKAIIEIVALLTCAGIVIGLITQTGLGVKLTGLVLEIAGTNFILALIVAAVTCLILGMGLPTTASYVLGAALLAPALSKLGLEPIIAHFFIFYYCILSVITPPVCLAVFTGAGIAKTRWLPTAGVALRLAVVAYIMPFVFVFEPVLLLYGSIPILATLVAVSTASLGAILLGSGFMGYFNTPLNMVSRLLLIGAAVFLFLPGWTTDIYGIVLLLMGILSQRFGRYALSVVHKNVRRWG